MNRILRLFACAAGMLALAVLACFILQDEETDRSGGLVVSGRIAAPGEAQSRASQAAESVSGEGDRSGAAKVKVLELAKAAAESRARKVDQPDPHAVIPSAAELAAEVVESTKPGTASAEAVEAEALALMKGELPATAVSSAPEKEAAAELVSEKKFAPAKPETAKPSAPEKAAKRPEVKKAEAEKTEKKAPEKKSAEKKKQAKEPARQLSAVESALADARSGRLAPVEDILREDDPARTYDRVVTSAKFSMKGSLIKLTLRGNSPMIGHFYVLEDPDRVVLDLAGNWQIDVPRVPGNRLIGAVRVGQHEDKTRLVFDMKNPGKAALVPLNRNALELRIQ